MKIYEDMIYIYILRHNLYEFILYMYKTVT